MADGSRVLIPATGTVRFIVWNYEDDDDIPTMLHIKGNREWRRPVVGLVFVPPIELRPIDGGGFDYIEGIDPLHAPKGRPFDAYPLVVNETGSVFEVHDYCESLMGEWHWDCATHFYEPHIGGPITDAPRILKFCPCGCTKEVKPGTDCIGEPVTVTA